MADYNIYDRQDKRRASLDLTKVKLPNEYAEQLFASLLHAINNGAEPGKIQVLVGLLGSTEGCEVGVEEDANGKVIITTK